MGPGDPAPSYHQAPSPTQTSASGPANASAHASYSPPRFMNSAQPRSGGLLGAFIGGTFGLLLVFKGLGAAIAVTACALVGMGVGCVLSGVFEGRLDARGAIDSFFRRGP